MPLHSQIEEDIENCTCWGKQETKVNVSIISWLTWAFKYVLNIVFLIICEWKFSCPLFDLTFYTIEKTK